MADALPEALKSWRITTPHTMVADSTAQLLGGTVHSLASSGDDVFEVLTDAAEVDIVVDAPSAITTELKLWGRQGLAHHCDGSVFLSTDGRAGSPCGCPASHAERRAMARVGQGPQVYTATRFRLAMLPGIGSFLHESLSWELAEEVSDIRDALGRTGLPAYLRLKLACTKFSNSAGVRVARQRPILEFVAPIATGWPRPRINTGHLGSEAARTAWRAVVRAFQHLRGPAGVRPVPIVCR